MRLTEHLFSLLNMRSVDLTAKAVIRDEALRLFAASGPDAVSVRQVASAAGVSPALVLHHWGSKEGLRAGVDAHVGAVIDQLLDAIAAELRAYPAGSGYPGHLSGQPEAQPELTSLAQAVMTHLPPSSPVLGYLRRLFLAADAAGVALMRRWYDASQDLLTSMVDAGAMRPGLRPEVRAAVLMANDLAVLLLRDGLQQLLQEDPLGPTGVVQWSEELLDLYTHGLLLSPGGDDAR